MQKSASYLNLERPSDRINDNSITDLKCEILDNAEERHDHAIAACIIDGQVVQLAFEAAGCRVVQEALEFADASEREVIVAQLHGRVRDAVASPYANFVVQKIVETMPCALASFVAKELLGIAGEVARHRYGCRIMCRLVEHQDPCSNSNATEALIDELLCDARILCLHSFARHVIGSVLEHGTSEQRHRVVMSLYGHVVSLAKKRSASYIVESAFSFCNARDRVALGDELLADSKRFTELAVHDAGSHVVRALLRQDSEQNNMHVRRARSILHDASARLQASKYGLRLLTEFQLLNRGQVSA